MRAAIYYGPRDITVGERPDPVIQAPTDAVVRVALACVCGSDLWYYRGASPHDLGAIGHEFMGSSTRSLLDAVLAGENNPGRVFDFETDLEHVVDAYDAMDERRAIKSLLRVGAAADSVSLIDTIVLPVTAIRA